MSENYDRIDELFQERFNGFEADVDPGVWQAVESQIPQASAPVSDGGATQAAGKTILGQFSTSTVLTVTSIAAAAVIAFGVYNYTSDEETPKLQNDVLVEQDRPTDPELEEMTTTPIEIEDPMVVEQADESVTPKDEDIDDDAINQAPKNNEAPKEIGTPDPVLDIAQDPSTKEAEVDPSIIVPDDLNSPMPKEPVGQDVVENNKPEDNGADPVTPEETTPELLVAEIEHEQVLDSPYSVKFKNRGQGSYHEWDMGDGTTSIEDDPKHTFNAPGEYNVKLTVRFQDGRTQTDEILVKVFEPSYLEDPDEVLTPNGDYVNDVLDIKGENMQKVSIQVFKMSGERVFVSDSFDTDWDGNDMNGRPLPEGSYPVVIEALGHDGVAHTRKIFVSLYK